MNWFKYSVQSLYICLAVWGFSISALAQSQIETPKKKSVTIAKPLGGKVLTAVPESVSPLGEGKLILDLKEIFNDKANARPEGPRTGGGGNSCALAIVENTSKLREHLGVIGDTLLGSAAAKEKVLAVMSKARFYVAERLALKGQTKDAINYPYEGVIVLSKNFCSTEMIEPTGRSMSLLLHEFLGLAKIDDGQYQISRAFLARYAEIAGEEFKLKQYLQREISKDLAGKPSCFKGAVKTKDAEMAETHGGRYSGEIPQINLHVLSEESSRQMDKYCSEYLDKNKKSVEDAAKAKYRVCDTFADQTFAVSLGFNYATSGSFGTEGSLFTVTVESTQQYILDNDNYQPELDKGFATGKATKKITCNPVSIQVTDDK